MFTIFINLLSLSQPRKTDLNVSVQSKLLTVENTGTPVIILSHLYSFVNPAALRGNRVHSVAGPLIYSLLVGLAPEPKKTVLYSVFLSHVQKDTNKK